MALVIALLLPAAWGAFLSEVRQSPVITATERDAMTVDKREAWFEKES